MRRLLVCVLLASAAQARAESRIVIRASGRCPSAAAIEKALPQRAPQTGAVELAVEEIEGGVIVRASSTTGPLEAKLDGRDCSVLASAVAAIADAWFVELSTAPPPRASAPPLDVERSQVDAAPERDRDRTPPYNIAVGRAFVFADRASLSATTRAELGWGFQPLMRLRARFDFGEAMTLDDVVRRQAWAAVVSVGPRLDRGRFWLEAAGGGGLVVSRVERMMPADEVVRAHGAFAGAAAVGIRLGAGASLRLDVDALLYPVRDVYTLGSAPVARSPRYELAAGLGFEIAFGARSR
jgi:hypothetical protein